MTAQGEFQAKGPTPKKVSVEWPTDEPAAVPSDRSPLAENNIKGVSEFYFGALADINKAYLDRATKIAESYVERAKLLQAAAVAIATIYTGLLGYVYATADNADGQDRMLSVAGIIPTVFLAAAIAFSMAFTSFLAPVASGTQYTLSPRYEVDVYLRRNAYVAWTLRLRLWRVALLQLSVLSLALGVGFLPVAFMDLDEDTAIQYAFYAVGGALILWVVGWTVYWTPSFAKWLWQTLPIKSLRNKEPR